MNLLLEEDGDVVAFASLEAAIWPGLDAASTHKAPADTWLTKLPEAMLADCTLGNSLWVVHYMGLNEVDLVGAMW